MVFLVVCPNTGWLAFDMLIADLINLNTGWGDRSLCNIDTLWPEARFFTTGETNDSVNFYWQDGRHNPHSWWSQRKKTSFSRVTFVRFYIQTNIRNRKKMRKNILIHPSWTNDANEFPNIFIWKGMVQISSKRILSWSNIRIFRYISIFVTLWSALRNWRNVYISAFKKPSGHGTSWWASGLLHHNLVFAFARSGLCLFLLLGNMI